MHTANAYAYCKCIYNTLHTPSVTYAFIIKDSTLFYIIQHRDKSFEALVVLKSLTLTIPVNPDKLQGHTSTKNLPLNQKRLLLERNVQRH